MSYDYVIVGAGTSGCVLANRLTEDPSIRVLLLEAGSRDLNPMIHIPGGVGMLFGPRVNWRFRTVPQTNLDNREIWYPQGKTLGGSSAINAMIYIRGQKQDYDNWADSGNTGWSYDDVLPYFKKSEDNSRLVDTYHGHGGPQAVSDQTNPHTLSTAFVRAAQTWGLPYNPDFNGATMSGAGLYQVTSRAGFRRSQATSFLRPALHRKNLTLKTHARVLKVVVEGGRATGVMIATRGNSSPTIRATREVILSSGAINTPRLMMLSGIGDANELGALGITPVHDLPGVGKNLMDHLNTNVHSLLNEPISYDGLDRFPRLLAPGMKWILFRTGPAASVIVEGGGFFTSPGADRPDMQIHIAPATVIRGGQTRVEGNGFTVNSTFLRPESVGTVRLASADPSAEPLIDPGYLSEARDRAMAIQQVRTIREVLSQPDIAPYIKEERLPGSRAQTDEEIMTYIRQYASCDYHPVGTCRMGTGPDAVVDFNLAVHGLDGLRVIDASIMPRLVSGNTMAATMMIAEKGADIVKAASPPSHVAATFVAHHRVDDRFQRRQRVPMAPQPIHGDPHHVAQVPSALGLVELLVRERETDDRAQWRIRAVPERPVRFSRSSGSAVTMTALTWLIAWVRALTADALARRNRRSISIGPSPVFATVTARRDSTARAAATASTTSVLPWLRRAARSGRLTSITVTWWRRR